MEVGYTSRNVRDLGRYRILERLASGGMAEVYRAEVRGAEGVRKEVALKLVRAEYAGSPEFVARFVREARLAARLSHANVVQIFEFDQIDGRHFIAMELVRGHHLGRVVERCRELGLRLGTARAVFVAAEVATALAYAHQPGEDGAPGLVHRDVSPHNVLVSWEGEVKLADFGIARAATPDGLTIPGTLEGKLAYVAPEQARGEPADARADLFALGVVLWELLTGARLFARESEAATLEVLLRGPVPSPPSAWNEGIPPSLDALVLRCLEREPARRASSARELAAELRAALLGIARTPQEWELRSLMHRLWPEGPARAPIAPEPTVRRAPDAAAPRAPVAAEPAEEATLTLPSPAPPPGRPLRLALALGGAVLVGGLGFAGWRSRRAEPMAAAAVAPPAVAGTSVASTPGPAAGGQGSVAMAPAPRPPESAPAPVEAGRSAPALGATLPAPRSGEGILSVNATPWASLVVDGRRVGDTPRELRLPAGPHRVRVDHPRLGAVEATLEIVAGRRTGWYPRLKR
jgi:serine/threonine-protein kinase